MGFLPDGCVKLPTALHNNARRPCDCDAAQLLQQEGAVRSSPPVPRPFS